MNNYCFAPSVIVRTPLYSPTWTRNHGIEKIVSDPSFQTALFLASRDLYRELQKRNFRYDTLSDKQKRTVWKYINRASFRSTPFGLFSSVSLVDWDPEFHGIVLSEPRLCIKLDFQVLHEMWEVFQKNEVSPSTIFHINPTFYFSCTDYRYIKKKIGSAGEISFETVSVAKNSFLKKTLNFCTGGRFFQDIVSNVCEAALCSYKEAAEYIAGLTERQILIPDSTPNITGQDYSHRLLNHLMSSDADRLLKSRLYAIFTNPLRTVQQCQAFAPELDSYAGDNSKGNHFYSLSERLPVKNKISSALQSRIYEGLHCLSCLSAPTPCEDMEKFKKAFQRKYESREVPLLEVLDSQFGIGYGDFEIMRGNYPIHKAQSYHSSDSQSEPLAIRDVSDLLLGEWQAKRIVNPTELEITDELLLKLKNNSQGKKCPASISVVFRELGNNLVLESVGGSSALQMIGRFSHFPQIRQFAARIAEQEDKSNRDVIFAEIVHVGDLHSANINRRTHLRKFEIPVMTLSTLAQEKQICLGDIFVSVDAGTVFLISKRLKKIVIPRLSSAYNHTKSSLSVFRFLYDIQNQNLQQHFSFSLESLLPGMKFYPRVRYKSCILQLATWCLKPHEVKHLFVTEGHAALARFRELAASIALPRYFSLVRYDNFLVFDSDSEQEMLLFLEEIKGAKKTIKLEEFPYDQNGGATREAAGHSLIPQYIASLYSHQETYTGPGKGDRCITRAPKIKENGEWLYLKIYCHPHSADTILTGYLFPFVKKYLKTQQLTDWFWVRYQDPDHHLRFRVKVPKDAKIPVLQCLSTCLHKLSLGGLVEYYKADVYAREFNRYPPEHIVAIEKIFTASSFVVVQYLKSTRTGDFRHEEIIKEAVVTVYHILKYFSFRAEAISRMCKFKFEYFFIEFQSPKKMKADMESLHRSLYVYVISGFDNAGRTRRFRNLQRSVQVFVNEFEQGSAPGNRLTDVVYDIIHMHLNRLFTFNQRYYEMVTYYLLYRCMMTRMHRNT